MGWSHCCLKGGLSLGTRRSSWSVWNIASPFCNFCLLNLYRQMSGRRSKSGKESLLQLLSPEFIPTDEWQEVQEWQGVPPGCHVKVDLNTGKKLTKIEQVTDR